MKKISFFSMLLFNCISSIAQVPFNNAAPNGYTKKAFISEQVGLTQVTVTYHRPAVNKREGKIWGGVVPVGFTDQGFGSRRPSPWRAGANENTVIEFDHDVKLEGQQLAKGRYGFFVAYAPLESTLIFSRQTEAWGSFFYDEREDVLRVKVTPRPLGNSVEFLKYEFIEQSINSAVIVLSWEKLAIPFKVEVDHLKQQFDAFVTESQNPRGFTAQGLNIAANWALQNNYQLETALGWATTATSSSFPGDPTSFAALSTRAFILDKLGRGQEATTVIKAALPYGNMGQLQQIGRQWINAKQPKLAMEVFQFNYDKNPNQFVSLMGMVRGLSAVGEQGKAMEFANRALSMAPNDANKKTVQEMIDKLKTGKDVN